jgi:hypothetical protein
MPLETITASESKTVELLKKRLSGFETKEGTIWVQQICHQLRTGGDMEFEEISQVVPWIELARDHSNWDHIHCHGPLQITSIICTI